MPSAAAGKSEGSFPLMGSVSEYRSLERTGNLNLQYLSEEQMIYHVRPVGGENTSETNRVRLHILQVISQAQSRRWASIWARRRVPTMTSDIWGM